MLCRGYGQELLDDLLRVITTSTLIAYLIYTIEVEQATLGGVNIALVTTAFVFYALFRYLHLLYGRDLGGVPEDVLFSDRPLQLAILLWGSVTFSSYTFWLQPFKHDKG